MDPSIIAAGVTTVLLPVVKKMTEAFAGESGKAAFHKAGELLDRLRSRFHEDPVGKDAVRRFEEKPEVYEPLLKDILIEKIQADPRFADELTAYLSEIKQAAPHFRIVQVAERSDQMLGMEATRVSSGQIELEQKAVDVKNVIGVKIDEIR